ncbi:DNA polymerase/3'-5' exonuclease PolX [Methanoculleus sp. FWC-SCC1]|uniref:DNA polymerase beta n=1 Tax=Methanoculleus frigidifontis TaxID=2584085 RepID=A0ABT8M884_9EURY|nr:DNA polymerase/3'-5' exonuclease PolX [Methanoculleus sp. FWC-SCC1]MDN7024141.1 DNA polymerase/3'-5' exonuclease PolX [Methanoculleus sp. FWC-SCC1]
MERPGEVQVSNRDVARLLEFTGQLLEISGGDTFKVRAYARAAQEIERLGAPVVEMPEEELVAVRGVGHQIARKVREIAETGTFRELDRLKASIPDSLIELLELDGVGPKTIHLLWKKLGIESVADLERAAKNRRIRALRGFGEKKEENILRAIVRFRKRSERMTRREAEEIVRVVTAALSPGTFTVAGSYRRGRSTVGDIDIVTREPRRDVVARVSDLADDVIDDGARKTSIRVRGRRVDIRYATPEIAGAMLLYLTGSKAFNIHLRSVAIAQGWTLNEYGLEERASGTLRPIGSEEAVFDALGMAYIPPELREDTGEIERAQADRLPVLVEPADVHGDLHTHTTWSDGRQSLAEIADRGDALGYEYILITDHSSSLGVARGLDSGRLDDQRREIERVNREHTCRLLAGVEVDIMTDGSLGLPDRVLADLDLVIASVHSGFQQESDQITRRVLAAVENEHVDIIGHPTGRLLGRRPPYAIDLARVIERAAETGTALEINASPHRLDLDDIYIRHAKEMGVKLSIGTDSHRPAEFSNMRYGIMLARRGWCGPADLLNTSTLAELLP